MLNLVFGGSDSPLGIPRVVVDAAGIVVKANSTAVQEFDPSGLVGQSYRIAIEYAKEPYLPQDHPIKER